MLKPNQSAGRSASDMPVDQLPYHWGYHVFMAAVMQLTGLALGQAMLIVIGWVTTVGTLSILAKR